MLGNGPHLLGIMLHSGLCGMRYYVAFRVMSFGNMSFGIMLHLGPVLPFGIMLHLALCRIRTYVVWDCVIQRNVVRRNVVQPTNYNRMLHS